MPADIKQLAMKKIGPLPAWVWVAVLVGGVVFARMIRGNSSGTQNNLSADDTVGDPTLPIDYPAGSDVTLPVGTTDGAVTGSGYDVPLPVPSDPVTFPSSDLSTGVMPWWLDPNYLASLNGVDTGDTTPVNPTTDTPPAAIATVQANQSFQWGGRIWSRGDLPAFKRWLQQHGTTYETWAYNHPTASQDVFGIRASVPSKTGVTGGGSKATQPGPGAQGTGGGGAPTAGVGIHAPPEPSWLSSAAASAVAMIQHAIANASPAPAHVASVPQAIVVKTPAGKATVISPGSSAGPAPAPAPHYYTYKKDVPIKSGQSIHFTAGRGYFAA